MLNFINIKIRIFILIVNVNMYYNIHTLSGQERKMTINQQISEASAGAVAKTSIGTGLAATVIGGIGLQDWLMIIGIFTTLGTFALNWYYQHKKHQAFVEPLLNQQKDENLDNASPE